MKLLTSVLPRGRRLLPSGGWFTLALFGFIAGLEVIGRRTTSDIHDGLAGFLLVGVIALVSARHRRVPLGWVQYLGGLCRRLGSSIAALRYDHGIDLRGRHHFRAEHLSSSGWLFPSSLRGAGWRRWPGPSSRTAGAP